MVAFPLNSTNLGYVCVGLVLELTKLRENFFFILSFFSSCCYPQSDLLSTRLMCRTLDSSVIIFLFDSNCHDIIWSWYHVSETFVRCLGRFRFI